MGVMSDTLTNDLFPQALLPVMLQGPVDLQGFRRAARNVRCESADLRRGPRANRGLVEGPFRPDDGKMTLRRTAGRRALSR